MAEPTSSRGPSGTIPRQAAPREPEVTGWVGWVVFAGWMMLMLGSFHAIEGLVALLRSDFYLVNSSGLLVHVDYTTWGWTHLVWGALVAATGIAVLAGQLWAQLFGVALAFISAIVNLAFLPAYPIWSTIMIALDVLVIWALSVHGREVRSL